MISIIIWEFLCVTSFCINLYLLSKKNSNLEKSFLAVIVFVFSSLYLLNSIEQYRHSQVKKWETKHCSIYLKDEKDVKVYKCTNTDE